MPWPRAATAERIEAVDNEETGERRPLIRFDNRINLGEVLASLTIIGGLILYFFTLDTRVTRLEERQLANAQLRAVQFQAIQTSLDKLEVGQNTINNKLDRKADRP